MSKYLVGLLLLTFTLISLGCNKSIKVTNLDGKELRFSLRKGVCFGNCPVFELQVYQNRYTTYVGEQNTDKLGKYSKVLSKEDFNNLEQVFQSLNFELYPDHFESRIPDLPSIEIGYHNGTEFRIVSGKEDRPEELMQAQFLLEKIADNKNWKFEEGLDQIMKHKKSKPSFIYNEVIIEPKKGLLLSKWLESNSKYGVRLVKKIAPTLDYYLIEFDTKMINPKDFIEILYKDSDIKSAEFNKKTSRRENDN